MTLLLILFALTAHAAGDINDKIRIEKVHGPKIVKVLRAADGKEANAEVGDMLYLGDTVITDAGQVVELSAFDKSAWAVAPGSRLKLESRKPDAQSLLHWTFQLAKGSMWGEVPKKDGAAKDNFRFKTKTKFAAMGIRGTEYLVGGDEKCSTLEVLEGTVWWGKNADFPEGSFKEVKAGQHAETCADGKITVHTSMGDKTALAKKYGVVPGYVESEQPVPATLEECTRQGKGWKSSTESKKTGFCFDKGEMK